MEKYDYGIPKEKHKSATVQAVVQLAAERNPNDITTGAIASALGVTQRALFRHFLNKDVIWQAVVEWVSGYLLSKVDQAINDAGSPLAALEAVFMAHIEFIAQHPGVPRMLVAELHRNGMPLSKQMTKVLIEKYEEQISGLIDTGKTFGEISSEVTTTAATTLFIGAIQGLIIHNSFADNPTKFYAEAVAVFDHYRRGLQYNG